MSYCENCGEREYSGACTNCHEVVYIAQQYDDLNMPMSNDFQEEVAAAERDIERKRIIRDSF